MSYWDITTCWNLSSVYSITESPRYKSREWRCPCGLLRPLNFPLNLAAVRSKVSASACCSWTVLECFMMSFLCQQRSAQPFKNIFWIDFITADKTWAISVSNKSAFSLASYRRMFPSVRVKVRNLDPCQQYYIAMDVMPVDSKRYRCVCRLLCVFGPSINLPVHTHTSPPAGMCITARSGWWLETPTTPASLLGSTCTRTPRAQERRGCVRSSALIGSNSPTTRWTTKVM